MPSLDSPIGEAEMPTGEGRMCDLAAPKSEYTLTALVWGDLQTKFSFVYTVVLLTYGFKTGFRSMRSFHDVVKSALDCG